MNQMMGVSKIELECHLWSMCCFGPLPNLLNIIKSYKRSTLTQVLVPFYEEQIRHGATFTFTFKIQI